MEVSSLQFLSGGVEIPLRLLGVRGREAIGELSEYQLRLICDKGPLGPKDLDDLVRSPCAFAFGGERWEYVHGIVQSIELVESGFGVAAEYLATVVPSMWLLTLSRINRIYQDMTVMEMVEDILKRYGLKDRKHYVFDVDEPHLTKKSHKREFCVQYEESDWDFIRRWLEQEGFAFYFEQGEESDRLVITDGHAQPIENPAKLPFHEQGDYTSATAAVTRISLRQSRIPARVVLKDYNYRQPTMVLSSKASVDEERGFGTVMRYGDHFRDPAMGQDLARRRADQIRGTRQIFSGTTTCSRVRVGRTFELQFHFNGQFNRKYLITDVGYALGTFVDPAEQRGFSAEFQAIPAEIPFRPALTTPWPSIHGVIHAHIDAQEERTEAELDEQGRYRVRFPFDSSGGKGGKASRWVRMAQPYSGDGYGSHFPLHKGTEVLVAFMDGDPDRPVIVGSIPNPRNQSPSTQHNPNQSVIQTASGIRIEMEDKQ